MTTKIRRTFNPSTLQEIEKLVSLEFHNALHAYEMLNAEFHGLRNRQVNLKRAIGGLVEALHSIENELVRQSLEEQRSTFQADVRENSARITELEAELVDATERKYTAAVSLNEMENATKGL